MLIRIINNIPWHIKASWGLRNAKGKGKRVQIEVTGRKYNGPIVLKQEKRNISVYLYNISIPVFTCTGKELVTALDSLIEK